MELGKNDFIYRIYSYQTLAILTRSFPTSTAPNDSIHHQLNRHTVFTEVKNFLFKMFERVESPTMRHAIEIVLISLCVKQPAIIHTDVLPCIEKYMTTRPTLTASLIAIAGYSLLAAKHEWRQYLYHQVVSTMLPTLSMNYGATRLIAQYFYYRILKHMKISSDDRKSMKDDQEHVYEHTDDQTVEIKENGTTSTCNTQSPSPCILSDTSVLYRIYHFLATNKDIIKLRERQDKYYGTFDPLQRCTVYGIMCNELDTLYFIPSNLLDSMRDEVSQYLTNIHYAYDVDIDPDINTTATKNQHRYHAIKASHVSADTLPSQSLSNYQRKFQITSTANLFDVLHTHGDNEHDNEPLIQSHRIDQSTRHAVTSKHTSTTSTPRRHSLIVCASLLDKAPNIAGLARTSEIFAIEKLIVHNRRVIEDPVFRNVSVTAGHWLDIEEIQPRELSTYLRSMKDSGYTVVAVEQTQYSISAEQFTFPEKVLLLLGREKEGIPIELLSIVDVCVEIPQYGIIRSLNVHVTGSIMIWEYVRQRIAMSNTT